ncbi:MAG TPA: helix-turn-helix domain-containing protein, partial [Puia sp.]|nr:helix-turn-helix domain-containing protein [Puia sp.]
EIATRRSLTETTVEGHLATFIPTGEINVTELVPAYKMERIASVIKKVGGNALGPIKTQLGPDYSFGEIKAMLQHLRHAEQSDK